MSSYQSDYQMPGGAPTGRGPASGVALILVLGVLSLMLIMGTAFVITMRTERLAAGNHADSVRARHLAQVGLVRALDQLQQALPIQRMYPDWNVTSSWNSTNMWPYSTNILRGSATNYVPRALWDAATNADWREPTTNHWLEIMSIYDWGVDPASTSTPRGRLIETNLIGRVKYLILNCSGLLDANYVGGATRAGGAHPREIAVGQLGELPELFCAEYRPQDLRYESLAELAELNDFLPSNFCVYSRALPGYWDAVAGEVRTQVNLAGDFQAISNRREQIVAALTKTGLASDEAYIVWRNLLDYIDEDSVPQLQTACVEAVPMLNEVLIDNVVQTNASVPPDQELRTTIKIELWYPFVNQAQDIFDLEYKATFTAPANSLKPADITNWEPLQQPWAPATQAFHLINIALPMVSGPVGAIDFTATLDMRVVDANRQPVDSVESLVFTNLSAGQTGQECCDPRFNAYRDHWRRALTPTLGQLNTWVREYFDSHADCDRCTQMYVANRPLQSVAELGYLIISSNKPWQTLRLLNANPSRVLDVFGLDTNNPTSDWVTTTNRGLVNFNTNAAQDALAAVLVDMPIDQYPAEPGVARLSMAEARQLAADIMAEGPYTNLADLGAALASLTDWPPGEGHKLERESLLRNCLGLFNLRQSLYTIIIEAQVASGGSIPRHAARQRAVALVWRDPYTGKLALPAFHWLSD